MSERRAQTRRFVALSGVVALCLGACASQPKPAATTPRTAAPPAPAKKLAWLPVETTEAPDVARALNDHLGRLKIPGATGGVKAAVSMEVAQLAIECTAATPACYGAVGRSLGVDQVLWAELHPASAHGKSIRVTLALFDVGAGTDPRRVEKTFAGLKEARAGVGDLVDRAFASESGTP
jgi:hypothetical protein